MRRDFHSNSPVETSCQWVSAVKMRDWRWCPDPEWWTSGQSWGICTTNLSYKQILSESTEIQPNESTRAYGTLKWFPRTSHFRWCSWASFELLFFLQRSALLHYCTLPAIFCEHLIQSYLPLFGSPWQLAMLEGNVPFPSLLRWFIPSNTDSCQDQVMYSRAHTYVTPVSPAHISHCLHHSSYESKHAVYDHYISA